MLDPDKRRIHALAAEGLSARAIARLVGSTHPTVAKVLASPPPPEAVPSHMAPPAPPAMPGTDAPDAPALQVVRELLAEARNQFALASAVGNSADAQRYARTAAGLTPVLARLEREERDGDGATRISRTEIDNARKAVRARVAAATAHGAVCSECARRLTVAIALGTGASK